MRRFHLQYSTVHAVPHGYATSDLVFVRRSLLNRLDARAAKQLPTALDDEAMKPPRVLSRPYRAPQHGSCMGAPSTTFPIISHLTALMSQFPLIPTPSSYQTIFDNALEQYKKKTGEDLLSHPLYAKLESCHFPTAIPTVLRQQLLALHQSGTDEDSLAKLLHSTVNVISAFSATIGGSIGPVSLRKGWLHALYPNT